MAGLAFLAVAGVTVATLLGSCGASAACPFLERRDAQRVDMVYPVDRPGPALSGRGGDHGRRGELVAVGFGGDVGEEGGRCDSG